MFQELWKKYREALPEFPRLRRPLVGGVLKETRVDKGIRQMDFAKSVGINESTLKSIENDHQQATTVKNLTVCAEALGLSVEEAILLGRERDPANYFAFKKSPPQVIKGIRQRKRTPEDWRETIRLRLKDFDVVPISPPIATKKDFLICKVNLPPKRTIEKLSAGKGHSVVGFVASGFNLRITAGSEVKTLTANQGFSLNGVSACSIANDDEDHAAVIYLMTQGADFGNAPSNSALRSSPSKTLDLSRAIQTLRETRSERAGRPLPLKHLADLTDSLDHEQIAKLVRLKKGSSVIYWEKIEDLLAGTKVSMEDFLKWARHEDQGGVPIATAATRTMIDQSTYHGVKIYSATPPTASPDFFCGELFLEPQGNLRRKSWERKDCAMIALFVEEGDLEITVGKRRSPLPLTKGESIYFDGSLGYLLRNPGTAQSKAFFATYPAIHF